MFSKSILFIGPRYLGSDLWVRVSLSGSHLRNLTDSTLAYEDTNSILTDNANRAIQGNVADEDTNSILTDANRAIQNNEAMQVMQPGEQPMQVVSICN